MRKKFLSLALALMLGSASSMNAQTFSYDMPKWSRQVNTAQNISKLSYVDLFYLKALVYAKHGCWYDNAEINSTLLTKCDWYQDLCDKRARDYMEKHDDDLDGFDFEKVKLTAEEEAFVQKIDKRMAELNKSLRGNSKLEPLELCINLKHVSRPSTKMLDLLRKNNFCLETSECEQLFNIYEENEYMQMPNFVTSDTYLQVAHMYLAYVQKYIEKTQLTSALQLSFEGLMKQARMMSATQKGEEKELLEFVQCFSAVGLNLITDEEVQGLPESIRADYNAETSACRAHATRPSAFMRVNMFPYELFTPRGHYTRSDEQKRYFHSMMWMQTAQFTSSDELAMKRAMMLALVYNAMSQPCRDAFKNMDSMIEQMMGKSDNVSIIQMADYMRQQGINSIKDVMNKKTRKKVMDEMARLNALGNQLSTRAEQMLGFTINLMPQRFMADNEVLAQMADQQRNAQRAYPRGIDVFAAFGSTTAANLQVNFYHDDKAWGGFGEASYKLNKKYGQWGEGVSTVYDKRLKLLVDLASKSKENRFGFINTKAWKLKDLNASLSSWATLKHDAILYAEQPMVAECGSDDVLPVPTPMGFVEPNEMFWDGLYTLITDMRDWLKNLNFYDDAMESCTEDFLQSIEFCRDVVKKEVKGENLSDEELNTISRIGSSIEWLTLRLIDVDINVESWGYLQGPDRQVAQIADVFTRNIMGCEKNGVLYTAVGNANVIYVVVPINGQVYLTRGATYGYYEFVRPLGTRLTDEDWQKMLEQGEAPGLPEWITPYYLSEPANMNERAFYSTGC